MLALATVLALATSAPVDRPRVEVRSSAGALDGPEGGRPGPPEWSRVRLTLAVKNHLPVSVSDLRVDVALLGPKGTPIPGWTFRELPLEPPLPGHGTKEVALALQLPRRRRSPAAKEIAYRVRLRSYRVDAPSLPLAFELLGSSHPSDQRAALASFERDPEWPEGRLAALADALRSTVAELPPRPSATDALRLLLAIRAIGTLELASEVGLLLRLPEEVDREAWGRAVLDLASRMVVASADDDPRLLVLPRWARRVATLLRVNARDALPEAAREAVSRIGDRAVPVLVRAANLDRSAPVRARARRLLERLGRGSPRSQVRAGSFENRVRVIAALGQIGDPEAVPALVEMLSGPEPVAAAAERALFAIGAAAVGPLVEALGRPQDERVRELLARLGREHAAILRQFAIEEGLEVPRGESASEVVRRLARRRRRAWTARLETEIADAIGLGAQGAHRAALERLDRVYARDPELYMRHADPIARIYVGRAERLLERGDYEAAIRVLSDGQTVRRLPEAAMRLTDARVALARGFLELGNLERSEAELDAAPLPTRSDALEVRARWLEVSAREALDAGRTGDARRLVDQARALAPEDLGLRLLDRRVTLGEHLAVVLAAGLSIPALGLALVLLVRRRLERRRFERLAATLEL